MMTEAEEKLWRLRLLLGTIPMTHGDQERIIQFWKDEAGENDETDD